MRADLGEVRSLTGLRGIAALLVVLVHTNTAGSVAGFGKTFIWHGYLWVDLFLLLSGFVLLRTYEGLFEAQPAAVAYVDFIGRRVARIWPLFALVTVATLAARQSGLTWFTQPSGPWAWTLAANLTMTQAWLGRDSIDLPGWSVSGEWACCLMFPLVMRLLDRRRGGSPLAVYAACLGALVALACSPIPVRRGGLDLAFPETPFPVFRCLASFSMGMALWRASGHPRIAALAALPLVDVGVALAIGAMMGFRRTDVAIVVLFGVLVVCLSRQRGLVNRLLSNGPCYWAGLVSYSVYLLQVPLIVLKGQGPIIQTAQQALAHIGIGGAIAGWLPLFYVLLLTCSAASWWLVERPSRRWLRRAADRLAARWQSTPGPRNTDRRLAG